MQLFVLPLEAAVPTVRCAERHGRVYLDAAGADAKRNTGGFKDKSNALAGQEQTEPTNRIALDLIRAWSTIMIGVFLLAAA